MSGFKIVDICFKQTTDAKRRAVIDFLLTAVRVREQQKIAAVKNAEGRQGFETKKEIEPEKVQTV